MTMRIPVWGGKIDFVFFLPLFREFKEQRSEIIFSYLQTEFIVIKINHD